MFRTPAAALTAPLDSIPHACVNHGLFEPSWNVSITPLHPRDIPETAVFLKESLLASGTENAGSYVRIACAPCAENGKTYPTHFHRTLAKHFAQKSSGQKIAAYVARNEDGKIWGFVRHGLAQDFNDSEMQEKYGAENWAELHQIYIASEAKGHGIGSALFSLTLRDSASFGADKLHVNMMAMNETGRAFYMRKGFREEKMHPRTESFWGPNPEDALDCLYLAECLTHLQKVQSTKLAQRNANAALAHLKR